MECELCKSKLKKQDRLCNDCKFNDEITVSKTNAKKTYKLSDDDLDTINKNIHYFEFRTGYGYGTRYLISELEKWIETDSGCLMTDKKYTYLVKIRKDRTEKENLLQIKENNKKIIKEFLLDSINKSGEDDLVIEKKYVIENDFLIDLDSFITDNVNIINVCKKLVNIVEKKACKLNIVNDRLKMHYEKSYNKHMKFINQCLQSYTNCINSVNEHQLQSMLTLLIKDLDGKMQIDIQIKRTNKLERLIKKENKQLCKNIHFYEYVRSDKRYKQYVEKNILPKNSTIDDLVQKINKSVKNKIEKDNRKHEIYVAIISDIDDKYIAHIITQKENEEYISYIKSHTVYKEYINKNKGELDNVILLLTREINKLCEIDIKKNILKQNVTRLNIALYQSFDDNSYKQDTICRSYIDGNVDIQTTLDLLQTKYGVKRVKHVKRARSKYVDNDDSDGDDIAEITKIIEEFDNDHNNQEKIINGYHSQALIFLNEQCKLRGYKYKRVHAEQVLITK